MTHHDYMSWQIMISHDHFLHKSVPGEYPHLQSIWQEHVNGSFVCNSGRIGQNIQNEACTQRSIIPFILQRIASRKT